MSTKNRQRRPYHHKNNDNDNYKNPTSMGYESYRSNDATAETLESDDSIMDIGDTTAAAAAAAAALRDSADDDVVAICIEGLELLKLGHDLDREHHHRMDDDDDDDDDDENYGDHSHYDDYDEEDSLVLTRKRLHRIWNPPPTLQVLRRQDSLELAHRRLAQNNPAARSRGRPKRRRVRPISRTVEERISASSTVAATAKHVVEEVEEEEVEEDSDYEEIQDLESVSLSNVSLTTDGDDDDDEDSFDCSATVDSLELTRKRFATAAAARSRINKREGRSTTTRRFHDGTDVIYLVPRSTKNHRNGSTTASGVASSIRTTTTNKNGNINSKPVGRIHSSRHHPKRRTIIHSLSPSPRGQQRTTTLRHQNSGGRVVRAALQEMN